ncbi:hypothetical protein Hanom_Chr11g00969421 [Helianthus anomalus]
MLEFVKRRSTNKYKSNGNNVLKYRKLYRNHITQGNKFMAYTNEATISYNLQLRMWI